MSDRDRVQELADKQAITELIHRYCRAVDRLDVELGHTIWHEDAIADYGDVYRGDGRGFIDHVCAMHRRALAHTHQITTLTIELDGERAGSEAYVYSVLRFQSGETIKQVSTWGRYIDRWSKRNGRWGIDKRVALRDMNEMRDIAEAPPGEGRRDRDDPSYIVLQGAGQ